MNHIYLSKKHLLFKNKATNFYGQLDELRKLRNRIHIQNTLRYKPFDETKAFSIQKKEAAEKIAEMKLPAPEGRGISSL